MTHELLRFTLEFLTALVRSLDLLLPHVLLALENFKVSGVVVLSPVQVLAQSLDLLLKLCFAELCVVRSGTKLVQAQGQLRSFHLRFFLDGDHRLVKLVVLSLQAFDLLLEPGVHSATVLGLELLMHLFQTLEAFRRLEEVVQEFLGQR